MVIIHSLKLYTHNSQMHQHLSQITHSCTCHLPPAPSHGPVPDLQHHCSLNSSPLTLFPSLIVGAEKYWKKFASGWRWSQFCFLPVCLCPYCPLWCAEISDFRKCYSSLLRTERKLLEGCFCALCVSEKPRKCRLCLSFCCCPCILKVFSLELWEQ